MPRLLGVEIPADKRIEASLTYIYGIGLSTAKRILEQTNIDPNLRAKNLTPQQLNEIIHAITNNKIAIEGDLRREVQGNLKRLQAINSYRGIRHRRGLPVRGQRTSTNARTRKGPRKTVGVIRNPEAKEAKAEVAPAEAPETEATPAAQDGAPAVSEQPSAKAEPAVKRAKKPAKSKKEEPAPATAAPRENLSLSTDEIEKPKVVKA